MQPRFGSGRRGGGVARRLLLATALASAVVAVAPAAGQGKKPEAPVRTVYHFTLGLEEASRGLVNIRNHLSADPAAKIAVVANGAGIDFLLDGAKDRNGNPYEIIVQDLKSQGVEFRLCNITLTAMNIDKSKVIEEATIVPSGVAEAARLQAREGYAYLRP